MRKKVTLAYITNDQERKLSYNKRKTGFLKKLDVLCTLCDVEACCIIYSPYETGPVVWPNPGTVHAVLERFKTVSPFVRIKTTMDQEGYNTARINKIHNTWYKIHTENKWKILELYMFQVIAGKMTLDCFDIDDAAIMRLVIKEWLSNLEVQKKKLEEKSGEGTSNDVGSYRAAATGGITIFEPDAVAGGAAISEAKAAADVAATREALTPLIPSVDHSTSLGMYNPWSDIVIHDDNSNIPNCGASADEGFSFFGNGIEWNNQLMDFDFGNNDNYGGGGDFGNDDNEDDDVDCSSSGNDDTNEDDEDGE